MIAIIIPNAFITVLGFAGLILSIIAILIPIYLLGKIKDKPAYYPQTRKRILVSIALISGFIIIISEFINMFVLA